MQLGPIDSFLELPHHFFRGGHNRHFPLAEPPCDPPDEKPNRPPEKIKMSMRKNFAYLAKSKYLICIALIVLTYNIAINLIEVVWKNQIKQLYPNPSEYNIYMGEVMTLMGIIATVTAILSQ